MKWNKLVKSLVVTPLAAFFLWGCGSSGGNGTLSVGLTDASTDQYQAVYVTVKAVEVHMSGDAEDSWETVGTPNKTYDLLQLVNGVRETLGIADLKAGHYTQMRLILGDTPEGSINILSLAHPFANYVIDLDGNAHELKVPSGMQTGIKIVHGFDINENSTTELVLDFNAGASVVIAGNSGKYLLKPTIKVLDTRKASIISGEVTQSPDDSGLAGTTVSAQIFDGAAADAKDRVTVQAATISDDDGRFSLFLSPGTYNLVFYKQGFQAFVTKITVAAGETATQDAALGTAATGTLSGTTSFSGGDPDAFITLSFRQDQTIEGNAEQIEITSLNVANGGSYSATLPEGAVTIVGSSFGQETDTEISAVIAGSNTTMDMSL
ncbi:MAG TPA: DUF4382 domain-containing protein [bacterium]|nr:DUF4382 domain-containing protein [bacterium]